VIKSQFEPYFNKEQVFFYDLSVPNVVELDPSYCEKVPWGAAGLEDYEVQYITPSLAETKGCSTSQIVEAK